MGTVYAQTSAWSYTGYQSEANASYIYAFFKQRGWSDIACAGLVGNTTHESYNNPAFHEVGGGGFGIVQWTPASNYTSWARPRGFPVDTDCSDPEKYLRGQCERIYYEWQNKLEFYPNSGYGYNWRSFANWDSYVTNTSLTPEQAAWLFMSNYERPAYGAAMSSLSDRQSYARRWYDKFHDATNVQQVKCAHVAAQWAIGIANNTQEYNGFTDHGYDQQYRWGERGDFDCSALVITAYEQANVHVKAAGATYTGDMRKAFLACGFQDITSQVNLRTGAGLIEGDVVINEVHHAVIITEDGQIVQSRINEKNQVTGGQPGDQTGEEINIVPWYVYGRGGWNYALRYDGYTNGFGLESASNECSILRAIPVTQSNWMDNPERNG